MAKDSKNKEKKKYKKKKELDQKAEVGTHQNLRRKKPGLKTDIGSMMTQDASLEMELSMESQETQVLNSEREGEGEKT